MRAVRAAHPTAVVDLWGSDEHRLGLKPILRAVWHRRGTWPRAVVHPRYQWLYLYAFVHPTSGQTFWLLLPTVSITLFSQALTEFAAAVGAGPEHWIVLVVDQAGWHTSRQVQVPEGLVLVFLPPYSPELQPAERLWPLTNEPLVNRPFTTLEELEAVQVERCRALLTQPEVIGRTTRFHWWPDSQEQRPVA